MQKIWLLLKKDWLLETRLQQSFYAVILYIVCTVFVIYLSIGTPENQVWNGLFWIVQLFVCINAVAKSFIAEQQGRMLYYYSIASPTQFILAKLIYNSFLMIVMVALIASAFMLLLQNPVIYFGKFILVGVLGGIGLSLTFSFLAAIAAKAKQQASLMAIMGFPIIIPQLLLLNKVASAAFTSAIQTGFEQLLVLLVLLDAMVVMLAIILFPYLWKD
jgi:heme exporter protein B